MNSFTGQSLFWSTARKVPSPANLFRSGLVFSTRVAGPTARKVPSPELFPFLADAGTKPLYPGSLFLKKKIYEA